MVAVSERSLEEAIERSLLAFGPDSTGQKDAGESPPFPSPSGAGQPGGYHKREPEDYDRRRCLIPRDVIDFIYATQPKAWSRLKDHHGTEIKERFLMRLARQIARRGTLDVLRKGIKDSSVKFELT